VDTVENSRSVETSEDMHRTASRVLCEEKVGFVHFQSQLPYGFRQRRGNANDVVSIVLRKQQQPVEMCGHGGKFKKRGKE
jgi:hypothetical protein